MTNDAHDMKKNQRRPLRREDRGPELSGTFPSSSEDHHTEKASRPRPANENDAYSAALTASLSRTPSRLVFALALLGSLVWTAAFMTLFFIPASSQGSNSLMLNTSSGMMTALVSLFTPVALIFAIAYFVWKAQKVQHASTILAQTALRLIKPQEIANEGLSSIATNVRKEIDQLIGGIEHAVTRAADLEGIVHREISNIERAFGSNEERIRTLLAGLENQRNALHEAGLVINTQTNPLLSRLMENTAHLESIVSVASSALSNLETGLKGASSELTQTIEDISTKSGQATSEIHAQTMRMEQVTGVLNNETRLFSENLSQQLHILDHAVQNLNAEGIQFSHHVKVMENTLVHSLKSSAEELVSAHTEVSKTLEHMTGTLSDQLRVTGAQVSDTLQSTTDTLSYHLKSSCSEINATLVTSATSLVDHIQTSHADLSDRFLSVSSDFVRHIAQARDDFYAYMDLASQGMSSKLEDTTRQLFEQMGERTQEISTQIDETAVSVFGRLEHASGALYTQLQGTTQTLGNQLTRLDQTTQDFLERAEYMGSAITDRLVSVAEDFTSTVAKTSVQLSEHFGVAANEVTTKLSETTGSLFEHLQNKADTIVAGVENHTLSLFDRVDVATDGVTSRLVESGQSLAHRVETQCEAFVERLEKSNSSAVQILDGAARDIVQQLEETTSHLADRLERSSFDLTGRLDDITLKITGELSETGALLTERLDGTSNDISAQLLKSSYGITDKLNDTTQTLVALLADKTSEISERVERSSTALIGKIDDGTRETSLVLDKATTQMTETLSQTSWVISDRLGAISQQVAETSTHLTSHLSQTLDTLSSTLSSTTSQVSGCVDTFAKRLDETTLYLTGEVDRTTNRLYHQLEDHSRLVSERLSLTSQELSEKFEHSEESFSTRFEQMSSSFVRRIDTANALLIGSAEHIVGGVDQAISDACEKITSSSQSLEGVLSESSKASLDLFLGAGERLFERFDSVSNELAKRFNLASDLFSEITGDVVSKFDQAGEVLAERLDNNVSQISTHLEEAIVSSWEKIDQKTGDLLEKFNHLSQQSSTRILGETGAMISEMHGTVTQLSDEFSTTCTLFKETTQELIGRLDNAGGEFAASLLGNSERMEGQFQRVSREVSERMDEYVKDLSQRFELTSEKASNSILFSGDLIFSKIDSVATSLNERVDSACVAFQDFSTEVIGKFGTLGTQFSKTLSESTQEVDTTLSGRVADLRSTLDRSGSEMVLQLSSLSQEISEKLSHSTSGISSLVNGTFHALTDQLGETQSLFKAVTSGVMAEFNETAETFSSNIHHHTGQITEELTKARSDLVFLFAEKSDEFVREFSQANEALKEGLGHTKDDVLSYFGRTSLEIVTALEEKTVTTTKNLEDFRHHFVHSLSEAHSLFSAQMSGAIDSLDTHIEKIGGDLASRLSETGDQVSSQIEEATRCVDRGISAFNAQIESLISDRQGGLSNVTEQLKEKQKELGVSLEKYVASVVEHLTVVQSRAEEVGKILSDQTGNARNLLEKSVQSITKNSDQAVQNAIQSVHTQHSELMKALQKALSGTTHEFSETASELKKTFFSVIDEVEKMRSDLKDQIGLLPEATRQNADAMRRVVSDQIAALHALSDVVRGHSGVLAFSGPGVRPAQVINAVAPMTTSTNVPSQGTSESIPSGKESVRQTKQRVFTTESSSSSLTQEGPAPSVVPLPIAVSEVFEKPGEEKKKVSSGKKSAEGGSSREIESLLKKLNSASRDFIETLEGRLPSEVEQRYTQGEGDAYAHYIYLQLGSGFREKVTESYKSNRLVRARVDAFLRLFERLLDHLATRGDGEALVDACLSSESGRIYLLLGQASGHLSER